MTTNERSPRIIDFFNWALAVKQPPLSAQHCKAPPQMGRHCREGYGGRGAELFSGYFNPNGIWAGTMLNRSAQKKTDYFFSCSSTKSSRSCAACSKLFSPIAEEPKARAV